MKVPYAEKDKSHLGGPRMEKRVTYPIWLRSDAAREPQQRTVEASKPPRAQGRAACAGVWASEKLLDVVRQLLSPSPLLLHRPPILAANTSSPMALMSARKNPSKAVLAKPLFSTPGPRISYNHGSKEEVSASRDEVGVSGCGVGSRSDSGSDWYNVVE